MSEVEKQESQKTVVAFITGLLIGGLLVWVFSSSPTEVKAPETSEETGTEQAVGDTSSTQDATKASTAVVEKQPIGEGSIGVADQKAGKLVTLGTMKAPVTSGWVVVRDYMDGVPGNILGAALFSADEGLVPTAVELMRETTSGSSYMVVFYTNEGAPEFKIGEDKLIDGISTTFKAN